MEQITIIINPDGGAEISVACVKGKTCKDITAAIEKALGKTTSDVPTAEMKEVARVNHTR